MNWDVFDTLGRYLRPATGDEISRAIEVDGLWVFAEHGRIRLLKRAVS